MSVKHFLIIALLWLVVVVLLVGYCAALLEFSSTVRETTSTSLPDSCSSRRVCA
jgi:cell shape-determining protein MreC